MGRAGRRNHRRKGPRRPRRLRTGKRLRRAGGKGVANCPELRTHAQGPQKLWPDPTEVPRLDTAAKSNGAAIFTIDITLPDMVTALVAHPTQFGAKVASFDD